MRLEPNTAVIPLSLPSIDGDNDLTLPLDKRDMTLRKSDTRRSSLAGQIKLTRIVEESEHDVSTNSSKENAARVADLQINAESESENEDDSENAEDDYEDENAEDDDSKNASDNDDQDEEDFDSDCSVMSDLDPKLVSSTSIFGI